MKNKRRLIIPNWVKNEISFSPNDMEKAFKKLGHFEDLEKGKFSFEWIVPKPTSVEECIEKYGEEYLLTDKDKDTIQADDGFPFLNWYNFQCQFWGCKWDAKDPWIDIDNGIIQFDTPWSPPEPVIKKLAEILGEDAYFCYCYSEEQGAIYNGEFFHTKDGDNWIDFDQNSDEAYDMYNQMWGETFIVLEDGNYHTEYDEEVFETSDGFHWFDFGNFEKYEDLAKQYHENYGFDFDDWIVEIYQCNEDHPKGIEEEIEKFKSFLMRTIGFYKPCWSDPTADPKKYETNHIYSFVSSFDEGQYVESFEETK